MYVRVIVLKYSSKIDADAMTALAKYEMIHKLEGIISIEVVKNKRSSICCYYKVALKRTGRKRWFCIY